jgi:type III restriction enzyme
VDLLAGYQIERHIRRDKDEGMNRLKKEVTLSPEFQALWDRIKPKTTYRVEFETDALVRRAVDAIRQIETITAPKIRVAAGHVQVGRREHHRHECRRGAAMARRGYWTFWLPERPS